jgi:hypothetical protein
MNNKVESKYRIKIVYDNTTSIHYYPMMSLGTPDFRGTCEFEADWINNVAEIT